MAPGQTVKKYWTLLPQTCRRPIDVLLGLGVLGVGLRRDWCSRFSSCLRAGAQRRGGASRPPNLKNLRGGASRPPPALGSPLLTRLEGCQGICTGVGGGGGESRLDIWDHNV